MFFILFISIFLLVRNTSVSFFRNILMKTDGEGMTSERIYFELVSHRVVCMPSLAAGSRCYMPKNSPARAFQLLMILNNCDIYIPQGCELVPRKFDIFLDIVSSTFVAIQ